MVGLNSTIILNFFPENVLLKPINFKDSSIREYQFSLYFKGLTSKNRLELH